MNNIAQKEDELLYDLNDGSYDLEVDDDFVALEDEDEFVFEYFQNDYSNTIDFYTSNVENESFNLNYSDLIEMKSQPSSMEDTFTMNVGIEDERAVGMDKALENYVIFKGFEIRHMETRSYKIKYIHKVQLYAWIIIARGPKNFQVTMFTTYTLAHCL